MVIRVRGVHVLAPVEPYKVFTRKSFVVQNAPLLYKTQNPPSNTSNTLDWIAAGFVTRPAWKNNIPIQSLNVSVIEMAGDTQRRGGLCLVVSLLLVSTVHGQLGLQSLETQSLLSIKDALRPSRINTGSILDTWDPNVDPCQPLPDTWLGMLLGAALCTAR